ncbi:MAG: hypothetical protein ACFFKA_03585, partial [Candidatus Thorarchaeota archaeon]
PGAYPQNVLNPNIAEKILYDQEYNNLRGISDKSPLYQEYSKNHLTDLFDRDYSSKDLYQNLENCNPKTNKLKEKKKFELEQERFGLEETLKALDSKFESGNISEIDYFKNFKKLQKELYKIDKKVGEISEEMNERDAISKFSKNFERRRYFS